MKVKKHKCKWLAVLWMSLFLGQAYGQYEMKKYSINSGSTKMQGSGYVLRSSIGQVDASNQLTGNSFKLKPGFWNNAIGQSGNDLIFKETFA